MKKKVLIIGANGFVGRQILTDLANLSVYDIVGASLRSDLYSGNNYEFFKCDIRSETQRLFLFKQIQPHVVINASALSVPDYCENHRAEAYDTNVNVVRELALLCNKYKAKLIHISSDFVFDGKEDRLHTENDFPMPVNYYGLTKLLGEQVVADICINYAIVRVVVVYGKILEGQHGNIFQLVKNRLEKGETIRVVNDQWRTPTYVGDVSKGIQALINHYQNGIYHISGSEYLSIADIAFAVAFHLKLDHTLIQAISTEEMHEATQRPKYSGLSIAKSVEELGYTPISIEQGMSLMFE